MKLIIFLILSCFIASCSTYQTERKPNSENTPTENIASKKTVLYKCNLEGVDPGKFSPQELTVEVIRKNVIFLTFFGADQIAVNDGAAAQLVEFNSQSGWGFFNKFDLTKLFEKKAITPNKFFHIYVEGQVLEGNKSGRLQLRALHSKFSLESVQYVCKLTN